MLQEVKSYEARRIYAEPSATQSKSGLDQLSALANMRKAVEEEKQSTIPHQSITVSDETAEYAADMEEAMVAPQEDAVSVSVLQPDTDVESEDSYFDADELKNMEDVFAELDESDLDFNDVLEDEFKENENSNDIILHMHKNGSSVIEIAKQLGLGVGEVKLVIDLYQGV